jgi:hypothetical protein
MCVFGNHKLNAYGANSFYSLRSSRTILRTISDVADRACGHGIVHCRIVHDMQTLRVHLRSPLPAHVYSGQCTAVDVSVGNELGLWQRSIYNNIITQHAHSTAAAMTHSQEQLADSNSEHEAKSADIVEGIPLVCTLRQCVDGVYTHTVSASATTAATASTTAGSCISQSSAAVTLTVVPARPVLSRNGRASFQVCIASALVSISLLYSILECCGVLQ